MYSLGISSYHQNILTFGIDIDTDIRVRVSVRTATATATATATVAGFVKAKEPLISFECFDLLLQASVSDLME